MTVARVLGIPLVLSPALAGIVVLGIIGAVWSPVLRGSLLVLAAGILASLFLHELAHGLAARRFGYDVDVLELTLWGGRAVWSGAVPDAATALAIAAAGPAVSALLAATAALVSSRELAFTNLLIAVVNLVPVTGSDGWVIWRAATASSTTPEP